jgi:hypothetical protein
LPSYIIIKCILHTTKENTYILLKKKQILNLVAVNDVSQTKVDQEKWQHERSEDKVCYTKKTKENNPGNFHVVRN